MYKYATLLAMLVVMPAYAAQDKTLPQTIPVLFEYDIISEGEDIGDMTSEISLEPENTYKIIEKATIEITSFWGDINIRSTTSEEYSNTGALLKANSTIVDLDENDAYWLKMENNNGQLWVKGGEGKVINKKEEEVGEGVVELAGGVATEFIPGLDLIMGVSDFIFSSDQDSIESGTISQNDFTTTFSNLPFYWKRNNENLNQNIIVLDTEEFTIDEVKFKYIDSRQERSGGKTIKAHHYSMTSVSEDEPMDVWLAVDHQGVPHFTEYHLKDDEGVVEVKLKQ